MAKIQHKDIVDPNIHEPKGITLAAEGQAYLADGVGGGSWKDVVTPETGTISSSHVGCTFSRGQTYTSNQNRTERLSANFSEKELRGDAFTTTSNYILIKEKGFYMISYRIIYSLNNEVVNDGWVSSELTVGLSESDTGFNSVSPLWGTTPKISTYKNKQGTSSTSKEVVRTFSNYFPENSRFSLWLAPMYISKSSGTMNITYSISGEVQLTKIPEIV